MNNRSSDSLVDITLEFLEAVIHEILFTRELYRRDIFECRRLYGLAVHRSRHPDLNTYIEDALHGLKDPIAASTLRKLSLVVLSPPETQTIILERFILEPRLLMLTDSTSLAAATNNNDNDTQARLRLQELESHLRAFFLKLQYVHASLPPLPQGCSFEIVAYMATRSGPGCLPNDHHWAEEDISNNGSSNSMGHSIEFSSDDNPHIIPIKSCTVQGLLEMQLYIEQPSTSLGR
jgi:mitotic spindle assembly checkpoint protein MAD2B